MDKKPADYDWVIIWGHAFHKYELRKIAVIGLLFASVFFGVVGYFVYQYVVVTPAQQAHYEAYVESREAPSSNQSPVEVLLEQHFAATGFDRVNSVRALGSYRYGEVVMDFELLAKQPGLYKQVLRLNGRRIEIGYDGDAFWLQQNHPIVDESDPALMRLNQLLALLECSIPAIAWTYEDALANEEPEVLRYYSLEPEAIWRGRRCLVVRNTRLCEWPVYHYLDYETKLEVYRRTTLSLSEGVSKQVELIYSDPLEASDYPLPAGFELWVDSQLYCAVSLDRYEVNRGLAGYLFKQSEE